MSYLRSIKTDKEPKRRQILQQVRKTTFSCFWFLKASWRTRIMCLKRSAWKNWAEIWLRMLKTQQHTIWTIVFFISGLLKSFLTNLIPVQRIKASHQVSWCSDERSLWSKQWCVLTELFCQWPRCHLNGVAEVLLDGKFKTHDDFDQVLKSLKIKVEGLSLSVFLI